jgi:glycosyltransferase involved in cell wall biosynthesis
MLDVGTYSLPMSSDYIKEDNSKIQGLWCGQLAEYKLPFVMLKALSKSKLTREKMQLTIIGKGPLESSMKAYAKSNNLSNINWISSISHEEVFEKMRSSDFLIHTGIKEASTSVIPEALSVGTPVICHDISGMGIAVNESCGIKIKLESPAKSIIGFNSAMEKLILDKELLVRLRKGAQKRASEISWKSMVNTMAMDYLDVVENK